MASDDIGKHVSFSGALAHLPDGGWQRFVRLFSRGTLSVELYAPRGVDPQGPHTRDEVYFVASGRGEFVLDDERMRVAPGDFLFVAAGVPHRFVNFSDDLAVWVMFYGPEGGEIPTNDNSRDLKTVV